MPLRYKYLDSAEKNMNATSGTLCVSPCRLAKVQVILDGNAGYDVAVKPTDNIIGTCSKNSAAAVLTNLGAEPFKFGYGTHYIAWRVYNGATAATGTATDKIIGERDG
jgi:hypothetical protein